MQALEMNKQKVVDEWVKKKEKEKKPRKVNLQKEEKTVYTDVLVFLFLSAACFCLRVLWGDVTKQKILFKNFWYIL